AAAEAAQDEESIDERAEEAEADLAVSDDGTVEEQPGLAETAEEVAGEDVSDDITETATEASESADESDAVPVAEVGEPSEEQPGLAEMPEKAAPAETDKPETETAADGGTDMDDEAIDGSILYGFEDDELLLPDDSLADEPTEDSSLTDDADVLDFSEVISDTPPDADDLSAYLDMIEPDEDDSEADAAADSAESSESKGAVPESVPETIVDINNELNVQIDDQNIDYQNE
ncbi:MAG: hypothetical protein ACP5D0_02120, partial [Hydrogenovibrio sp.]